MSPKAQTGDAWSFARFRNSMMYPLVLPETSKFARSGRLRNSLLLIHYFLPLVVGWSLTLVMRQATRASLSPCGLALLLAGIGAAYCFDRLIDTAHAPIASPLWLHRMLRWGFAISACILLILILAGEIQPGLLVSCGLLTIVGFLYSYLKRIPLAKTIGVALAWSWACATLPFANAHAARWEWLTNEASLPLVLLILPIASCAISRMPRRTGATGFQVCLLSLERARPAWLPQVLHFSPQSLLQFAIVPALPFPACCLQPPPNSPPSWLANQSAPSWPTPYLSYPVCSFQRAQCNTGMV